MAGKSVEFPLVENAGSASHHGADLDWIGITAGLYRGLELSPPLIAARDKWRGEQQKEVKPAGQ